MWVSVCMALNHAKAAIHKLRNLVQISIFTKAFHSLIDAFKKKITLKKYC